jgi:hypothetical protein
VAGLNLFDLIECVAFSAMAAEVVVGCVSVGFVSGRAAWLRSSYFHKIDFAVLLLTALDYTLHSVLAVNLGLPKGPYRVFRLFRLLRPVRPPRPPTTMRGECIEPRTDSLLVRRYFLLLLFRLLDFMRPLSIPLASPPPLPPHPEVSSPPGTARLQGNLRGWSLVSITSSYSVQSHPAVLLMSYCHIR